MRKKMSLKKLIAANPAVNAQQLQEALRLLRELRKAGVDISGYGLELPFSKRVTRKEEEATEDSRLVRLRKYA